jgi:PAS domain S-box-containing protein
MTLFERLSGLKKEEIEKQKDMLLIWRKKIFFSIFLASLIASFIPYLLNIKIAISSGQISSVFIYSLVYVIGIFITFMHRIPFAIRAWVGLLLFFVIGVFSLIAVGPPGGGRIWMFMFAVLTTLLLGLRPGIIALLLNVAAMFVWIWAWSNNYFTWIETYQILKNEILAIGASFVFLNSVVTVSLGIFVSALEKGFQKEQDLSNNLRQSNEQLLKENEERRKAEEALRESEEKYRLLADNLNDMIWMLDITSQRITYVSPSVQKTTGFSPKEIMALSLDRILFPGSYQKAIDVLADELARDREMDPDRSVTLELEQYRKDGSTISIELTASFVRDNEKQPIAVLGVTRDITERREAEQAIREKEEKLTRLKKMESLGLMAGGIAHDLNNILSGVVSYPDLLLMDLPSSSPLRRPLEIINESGHRAAAIVADLLTVARGVATGKEVFNLNTLVEEYMSSPEQKRIESKSSSVTFRMELDPELLNIQCSESHIKKTLSNLILNASEAIMDRGTVSIATKNRYLDEPLEGYEDIRSGEYVLLTVSDSGTGISSNHLGRIFEPFYSKKFLGRSGTGLGLAIVWNTVQDHDGYVNIKSNNEGTVFELYFPATRKDEDAEREKVHLADYQGEGEKILVIDDEENQRIIACELLSKLGYKADAVSSGEEAVPYLKENPIDLLLLDMIMPRGMNGLETYRKIIEIRPKQKAIIASGYAETEDVKATQDLGAGKYIKKPYTLEKLGLVVKEELEK